jgi:hypothetical protein
MVGRLMWRLDAKASNIATACWTFVKEQLIEITSLDQKSKTIP